MSEESFFNLILLMCGAVLSGILWLFTYHRYPGIEKDLQRLLFTAFFTAGTPTIWGPELDVLVFWPLLFTSAESAFIATILIAVFGVAYCVLFYLGGWLNFQLCQQENVEWNPGRSF